jgi:hypothetical protein
MSDRHSRALGKLGASLAPLFDAEDFETAKKTLIASCHATRRVRAGKDPATGEYRYVDVPDFPTRTVAAVKVLEWCAGKPVARSITANLTPGDSPQTQDDFFRDVLRDPAAVSSLRSTMEQIIDTAEKLLPVDVTARAIGEHSGHE